jgi:hypothetical protein
MADVIATNSIRERPQGLGIIIATLMSKLPGRLFLEVGDIHVFVLIPNK